MKSDQVLQSLTSNLNSPFYYVRWLVVPNVTSFGHECDVLALSSNGYAHEIEIKISKSDLKKDLEKKHGHRSNLIRMLWFAGPKSLESAFLEIAPERAGIILIDDTTFVPSIIRQPLINELAKKFTVEQRFKLARLGTLRFWNRLYKDNINIDREVMDD